MKKYISNFIVCYVVWILLAGVSVPELVLGAAVSAVLSALLWKLLNLELSWNAEDNHVYQAGPAEYVFDGEWLR